MREPVQPSDPERVPCKVCLKEILYPKPGTRRLSTTCCILADWSVMRNGRNMKRRRNEAAIPYMKMTGRVSNLL